MGQLIVVFTLIPEIEVFAANTLLIKKAHHQIGLAPIEITGAVGRRNNVVYIIAPLIGQAAEANQFFQLAQGFVAFRVAVQPRRDGSAFDWSNK